MTSTLFGLEVWLGPMEGHRYVGPGVNGVVRVGRVEKDKNRGAQNQFVISKGLGISASHAELRMDRGRVFVRDLGSTNGTFADQKRLSGEVEIEPGSMILFSFTPVRVDLLEEMPTTSMVIDAVVASDFGDANLEILLDAARKAAEARKESFLDTRHLADAVLRSRNPWLQKVLRDAGWAREDALAELWEAALFQEPEKWLAEVLMRPVELKAAANDFLVAPKVATFLRAAVRRLKNVQDDPETALRRELLGFLVADERGAVGTWLKAHGLQVPSALAPSEEEVLGGGPRRSWEEDDLKETHLEKRRFPVPPTEVPGIDAEGEPPPRRGFVSQRMPSVAPDAGPKTTLAPPRRPSAEEPAVEPQRPPSRAPAAAGRSGVAPPEPPPAPRISDSARTPPRGYDEPEAQPQRGFKPEASQLRGYAAQEPAAKRSGERPVERDYEPEPQPQRGFAAPEAPPQRGYAAPDAPPQRGYAPAPEAPPQRGYAPAPEAPQQRGYAPAPEAPPQRGYAPAPEAPPFSSEGLLDPQAGELGRDLLEIAATYRHAAAEDRREALRVRVLREVRAAQPDKGRRIVEQTRKLFPVPEGASAVPAQEEELARLRREVKRLERELDAARSRAEEAPKGAPGNLRALLPHEPLTEAMRGDPRLLALRESLQFAFLLERFLLSALQTLTMPGNETTSFRLQNFSDTLEGFLGDLISGKETSTAKLEAYLAQLQRWQVALFAAYHEAPRLWFEKLWKKINPSVIESAPRPAGWKLRSDTTDWWETYRQVAHGLSADVAQDQILKVAAQFAKDEFEKLRKAKG